MKLRSIVRRVAGTAGGTVLAPFLQAPAAKLAETLHFDTAFSDRWGPLMQWLSDLTQSPWYTAFAGLAVGFALGMWADAWLRTREETDVSSLQTTIADLKKQLEEPERQRRQAFENGLLQARAEFANEMRKYMYGRNAPHIVHTATSEVIEHLESYAVVFASDDYFSRLWKTFFYLCEREVSVMKIPLDFPDPDGFVEVQTNRSSNYYFASRKEITRAIIAYLTYDVGYKDDPFKRIADIRNGCIERGMVEIWDIDSLKAALTLRESTTR